MSKVRFKWLGIEYEGAGGGLVGAFLAVFAVLTLITAAASVYSSIRGRNLVVLGLEFGLTEQRVERDELFFRTSNLVPSDDQRFEFPGSFRECLEAAGDALSLYDLTVSRQGSRIVATDAGGVVPSTLTITIGCVEEFETGRVFVLLDAHQEELGFGDVSDILMPIVAKLSMN